MAWKSMTQGASCAAGAVALLLAGGQAHGAQNGDDGVQERRSSLVQRPYLTRVQPVRPMDPGRDGPGGDSPAVYPLEFRTIDGMFNNLDRPWLGSANVPLTRVATPAYGDASGDIPARADGPSARAVSNAVNAQVASRPNELRVSDMLWQWGQFLDHDVGETPFADPPEHFDIPVPAGDRWFDPRGTGTQTIKLDRSGYQIVDGRREQVNHITAFVDASNVYGSDGPRARELRTLDGTGELKTSDGGLLPFNVNGFPNAPDDDDPSFFLAGDVRANEQVGLTAMHTLFVREHNHWARQIRAADPTLPGDEVYERARAIVAAEMQAITYNEFLPLLLGEGALAPYEGYRSDLDPGIANVFSAAAYRVGHTMLSGTLLRRQSDGSPIAAGDLSLADAFFTPREVIDHGIDSVLRGLTMQRAQEIDNLVVDEVRNFLFGPPGAGGFDLASLNIQRGRDHGLPDYNTLRRVFGLPTIDTFEDINPDPAVWQGFAAVYDSVDAIDPWPAMLAEPQVPGALVGPTLRTILAEQFRRLRDGDRFWYTAYLPQDLISLVERQTLTTILRRHTSIGEEVGLNAFIVPRCELDLDGDGRATVFDFLAFANAFDAGDDQADWDGDGELTVFDFLAFQSAFDAGCE